MGNNQLDNLNAILDINRVIFSTLEPENLLYLIVKKISEVLNDTRCSLIHIDKSMKTGHVLATNEDPELKSITIELSKYPEICKAIEDDQAVIIKDIADSPLIKEFRENLITIGIQSIIVIPIHYHEGAMGILYLKTLRRGRQLNDKDINTCQIVASMASIALRNSHIFNAMKEEKSLLEKMAVTDGLTLLYNHRFFVRRLHEEFKRAKRYNTEISYLMIDLDDFKNVNDTYGHQKGDTVLQKVAKVIKRSVRETDIVARYGGEEFAVLLPHTNKEDALSLAHRIRKSVRNFKPDFFCEDASLTVSVGVSTFPNDGIATVDDLIRRADDNLYQAKGKGKDAVV
ncbi:MAG: sensor domain-containing diguanylate cyclase [Nitrospira sp.]|nr:sensor domain-containing diguanylate cyclase [Nitrospira sp.]